MSVYIILLFPPFFFYPPDLSFRHTSTSSRSKLSSSSLEVSPKGPPLIHVQNRARFSSGVLSKQTFSHSSLYIFPRFFLFFFSHVVSSFRLFPRRHYCSVILDFDATSPASRLYGRISHE